MLTTVSIFFLARPLKSCFLDRSVDPCCLLETLRNLSTFPAGLPTPWPITVQSRGLYDA